MAQTTASILILNGPNLNRLGLRQPEIYGRETLADIEARCRAVAPQARLAFAQSNHEGALVDAIHQACDEMDAIIINPAAYTHSSIALRDALAMFEGPIIEVHLSNIHAREAFRQTSHVSPVADGVICGLGPLGYELALTAALARLEESRKGPPSNEQT